MDLRSIVYPTDIFFEKTENEEKIFKSLHFERKGQVLGRCCSKLIDVHVKQKVEVHFLRVSSETGPTNIRFSSAGTVLKLFHGGEFGVVLIVDSKGKKYTVWLPSAGEKFRFDESHRIIMSEASFLSCHWEFNSDIQLNLFLSGVPEERAIVPYMIIEDESEEFAAEIKSLGAAEKCLYRKTDWFFARKPSDIWGYLINGSIYDPRLYKGIDKRFKCQQCAFSWWSYFGFLNKETGKKLYDILQSFIAYSVLLDMSSKGEWGHGFWSDEMETHARFHLDGIHLLISQYEKNGESLWVEAAERGMAFVAEHLMEQFDDGSLWFLHDTTEHKDKRIHFQSSLFGKSPGNSLCINTHVQALTVLNRLVPIIPENKKYSEMLENGIHALHRVLEHQPASALYNIFIFMFMNSRRKHQSLVEKVVNAVKVKSIKRGFWFVRRLLEWYIRVDGLIET